MGESVVERPTIESKMGESVHPTATLEVSVSFGRFENDVLSWEKWSSFSPNKYLEEVEKCSTPGSVAQKKAYFEAHYKKIAARKAEQSEQEKTIGSLPLPLPTSSDEPEHKDRVKTASGTNVEIHLSGDERPAQDVKAEISTADAVNNTTSEKRKEDNAIAVNPQDLTIDETKEELDGTSTNSGSSDKEEPEEELTGSQADPESSVREESTEVQEETAKESCPEVTKQPLKVDEVKNAVRDKNKGQKLSARYSTQKITPRKKEQISAKERKKIASPAIKSSPGATRAVKSSAAAKLSHFSTPRLSKSTMMSATQSSTKKVNGSSLPKSKAIPGEYRKSFPTSLHMSLSLEPVNSGASFTTTRKSLIMEKMGDKEIVRRAFKTFQNSINGLRSSTDGLFSGSQQASYKESEKKVPNTLTLQKENEGKTAEKINQGGHPGNRSNLSSMGSHKGPRVDKKSAAAVSPSARLRSDAIVEKRKEDKSNMREVERSQLGAKKKEEKEAQTKSYRQGINSKASPMPVSNRGKTMSKFPSEKEDRGKIHHQPTSKR